LLDILGVSNIDVEKLKITIDAVNTKIYLST